jgi:site-specific DNA-cytosine methylase
MFSTSNTRNRVSGDNAYAKNLVEWYLNFALSSNATSWTMEQVAAPQVVEIVERIRTQSNRAFEFAVFDFNRLGVPQSRKRLIAGTPALVANLLRIQCDGRTMSVRMAIPNPPGEFIQNGKRNIKTPRLADDWMQNTTSIDNPSYTVTSCCMFWCAPEPGRDCGTRTRLTTEECMVLQTFPSWYKFPANKTIACKQIANAVPPNVARLLLKDYDSLIV